MRVNASCPIQIALGPTCQVIDPSGSLLGLVFPLEIVVWHPIPQNGLAEDLVMQPSFVPHFWDVEHASQAVRSGTSMVRLALQVHPGTDTVCVCVNFISP